MPGWLNLKGKRFGRLVAEEWLGNSRWLCRCDCGGTATVITTNLRRGNSTSCGCRLRESRIKHGMSGTPVWHAWQMMIQRCENPKDQAYKNYGGRGIRVCDEWHDFATFVADMGVRPAGFWLERLDNDGPYSKANCRWKSVKVNQNNRRTNHRVEFNGETKTITQWADETGIHPRTLHNRITRGWPIERALTEPVLPRMPKR